jgi:FkbM family methyltransferase
MLVVNDCSHYCLQMIYRFPSFEFFKFNKIQIDSVLDIGAHKGDWIKRFKEHFPNVKSLTIEANADHGADITALVGAYNGETDYYMCEDEKNNHGNGIYKENTNVPFTSVRRKIHTLDKLLSDQRFDLIKMDTQGAELDIIQGSPGFIHKAKFLWLELQPHHYNIGAPSAGKVIGYLHQIGFEMVTIDEMNTGNGMILGMDVIFVNTRNKDLAAGYNINKKVIWGGYAE